MTFDSVGGRAGLRHNKKTVETAGGNLGRSHLPGHHHRLHALRAGGRRKEARHRGRPLRLGPESRRHPGAAPFRLYGPYVVASYGVTEDTIRQAAQRAGSGDNIYYVTRYAFVFDNNPSVAEVAAAQKKYGTSKPFSSMHVTGWALGKFAEAALKALRLAVHARKARHGHPDPEGRHGRLDRRTDRNVGRPITTARLIGGSMPGTPRPTRWSRRAIGSKRVAGYK